MWAPNDKRWLIPFGIFFSFVVGLLLWLHIFGVPQMEYEGHDFTYEGVVILESTPSWFVENMALMDSKLPDGYRFPRDEEGKFVIKYEEPEETCTGDIRGDRAEFPCELGWVTVVLWDEHMANCDLSDNCETGIAFWDESGSKCVIMIPPKISDALPLGMATSEDAKGLPVNAEALVGAHEWVHCKRGDGHVFTKILGPFYSIPTGHLMHPSTFKSGWGTEGLGGE